MNDPIDALLADLRDDVPEMSDQAFEAGLSRLQAVVAPPPVAAAPKPALPVVPLRKRRLLRSPPRTLVASAAAVVVLAAGVLAGQALRSDGGAPVASAAARLNFAADQINPVDEPIRPDQYRYIVGHSWSMISSPELTGAPDVTVYYLSEWRDEKWAPADLERGCTSRGGPTGNIQWIVGDAATAEEAGITLPKARTDEVTMQCDGGGEGWWGSPSTEWLASLPRDPAQLYDRMRQESPGMWFDTNADLAIVGAVASALGSGLTPADLRAALYRALALLPGLQITEQTANLDGHKGTAFGLSRDGKRVEVIIDPATGQYIGGRVIAETGEFDGFHLPPGTVVSSSSVSNPVVVDKVGETR